MGRIRRWLRGTLRADRFEADEVDAGSVNTDETHTKTIGADDYRYAGDYDFADADTRLDEAISDADSDSVIFLENETYSVDRTISKRITFKGVRGSSVESTWTLDSQIIQLENIRMESDTVIEVNADHCRISGSFSSDQNADVNVNADNFRFYGNTRATVTFASDTADGIVGVCSGTDVIDNGSNTVGDIA